MTNLQAPELSIEMFGGVLDADSSASYPGLELINFLLGCSGGVLPEQADIKITRYAHDFARRLVRDETLSKEDKANVLADKHSEEAIRKLLKCLELELENITKSPTWMRTHFFPYTKSLTHWDARIRLGTDKVRIERQYLRGAGAYVFNVLRFDHDKQRLSAIREKLDDLFTKNADSPLESLAKTLRAHGAKDIEPVKDEKESESRQMREDGLEDLYRIGVQNILSHDSLPSVSKIKAIVNWTGIWLVVMGNKRSKLLAESNKPFFVMDCAGLNSQLRRASQRSLKGFIKRISDGIDIARGDRVISAAQAQKIKGFFTATAAGMRLINSLKGRRHFTFGLDCIETLALVAVNSNSELPFENFVHDWLFKECGFVIGRISAQEAGLLDDLDATIFEENEKMLSEQVKAVGMLRVYSDATKMVGLGKKND